MCVIKIRKYAKAKNIFFLLPDPTEIGFIRKLCYILRLHICYKTKNRV